MACLYEKGQVTQLRVGDQIIFRGDSVSISRNFEPLRIGTTKDDKFFLDEELRRFEIMYHLARMMALAVSLEISFLAHQQNKFIFMVV